MIKVNARCTRALPPAGTQQPRKCRHSDDQRNDRNPDQKSADECEQNHYCCDDDGQEQQNTAKQRQLGDIDPMHGAVSLRAPHRPLRAAVRWNDLRRDARSLWLVSIVHGANRIGLGVVSPATYVAIAASDHNGLDADAMSACAGGGVPGHDGAPPAW
jgi:hypothetical protein